MLFTAHPKVPNALRRHRRSLSPSVARRFDQPKTHEALVEGGSLELERMLARARRITAGEATDRVPSSDTVGHDEVRTARALVRFKYSSASSPIPTLSWSSGT
jgi:hypothetical protein